MKPFELGAGIFTGLILFLALQNINIFPLLFLAGVAAAFYFGRERFTGQPFAVFNKADSPPPLITFAEIGGQEMAKNELQEALEFIKNSESIKRLGIRPLRGILLTGPPGTGKTLLAKAAAQYTDAVFLAASGAEFVEMYVGVGAQRIRQLFSQARNRAEKAKKTSAVIFIDEIEIIGGKRGQGNGNLEYDQTLNELLVQMDGLTLADDIQLLVIGATNRVDILDAALIRPGRFDRQVKVDLPDKKGRQHILALHTRSKPLAAEVNLEDIAADTFGFSGAHLESLTNEAAILALREGAAAITTRHLKSAIDKVMMGEKLDRTPTAAEKHRIAVHEAGHALVSELLAPGSVATVNIASRSNALGYVRQAQSEDQYLYTLEYLQNKIAVALAGATAEELILGNRSTGAANDFEQAANLAKQIIFAGLSRLGIISPADLPPPILHRTLSEIITGAGQLTGRLLTAHQKLLTRLTDILLKTECISGAEFRALLLGTDNEQPA